MQVRFLAACAYPDADYRLPSKSAIKDKKLELVAQVGGQTSARTTFDLDIMQVMVRDLMYAQERMREEVLDLLRKNRARMRGVE